MRRAMGTLRPAQLGIRAFLAAVLCATLVFSAGDFVSPPALAQGGAGFDWGNYCNGWIDRQIAAGRVTESQRSAEQSVCMAAQWLCMAKYGAFTSVNPEGVKKEMDECFVGMMDSGEANSTSHGSEGSGSPDRRFGEIVMSCFASQVIQHLPHKFKPCSEIIASTSSVHEKALAYAYRAVGEVATDNHDRSGRASADANNALALDEDVGEAYFVRGEIDENKGRWTDAISNFDRTISLGVPTEMLAAAYYARGLIHSIYGLLHKDRHQYELAVPEYDHAIALLRKPDYFSARADVEESLGQKSAAEADRAAARQIAGKSH